MTRFQDEQDCRDYLVQHRWGGKPKCPYCGCDKSYRIENGKRFKCANKECHKKYSVTVGTVAEDSNIALSTWFAAIYVVISHKKGISSVQLGKDLGIPQRPHGFYCIVAAQPHAIRKGFYWSRKCRRTKLTWAEVK